MTDRTLQSLDDLEQWHSIEDPWKYESTPDDAIRKSILLSELPRQSFHRVLDIGCGQGYVTRDLPGEEITGIDISAQAIRHAQQCADERIRFIQGSIFDLDSRLEGEFDLIVVTGVLYPQYIGHALGIAYRQIIKLLADSGFLVSVHIDEWYEARFPLLRLREYFYPYREYTHRLEIYVK